MNIVLVGPSGAGKGTHAPALAERFGLRHVSTGDLLRANLESGSVLGTLARGSMDRGELVSDEVVDAMVEEWLRSLPAPTGALFDGFPQTTHQARFLEALLARHGRALDAAVYLAMPDDAVARRLASRRRSDDGAATVQARLRTFHRNAAPLLELYALAGKLVMVDGAGTVDAVGARLVAALDGIAAGRPALATVAEARAVTPGAEAAGPAAERDPSRLDIVLLGGPGSGKGTQAEKLAAELAIPHIATGDLFRDNLKRATELGQLAKGYMERGELVPDDVTEAMVQERLGRPDAGAGFILDGFPRTLPQAQALQEMMAALRRELSAVLYVVVSDEEIVGRLAGRRICRECQAPYHERFKPPAKPGVCDACGGSLYQRADDNPATVRARLQTFHGQTEPLVAHYRDAGLLREIDGEGDVAAVTERTLHATRADTHS